MAKATVFLSIPFSADAAEVAFRVQKALSDAGLGTVWVDSSKGKQDAPTNVADQIRRADVVVADMSGNSPNVYYEIGLAHAWRKPTILIRSSKADSPPPADLEGSFVIYDPSDLTGLSQFIATEAGRRANRLSARYGDSENLR